MTQLNSAIDKALGDLVRKKGKEGFTYTEIETRVRTQLGSDLQTVLVGLGNAALRDRVARRARTLSKEMLGEKYRVHPSLLNDELAPVYPVHRHDGETVLKALIHMKRDELGEVIEDLKKQRGGLDRHIKALLYVQEKVNGIWETEPLLTIEEAQAKLFVVAAE